VTGEAQLHHYVPQFYLRRFLDDSGRLWAWDRDNDRVFRTTPKSLAAERSFYHLDLYADENPMEMEKQFSHIEQEVAQITAQWLEWIPGGDPGMPLPIPSPNRELVSQFIGLQFLRTADAREIISLASADHDEMSETDRRILHTEALWNSELVGDFIDYIGSAIWIFGRNETQVPYIASDNPVAFRTPDHMMWLKVGIFGTRTYVVYPLSPQVVMYCYPRTSEFRGIEPLDTCILPVEIPEEMVRSDNTGQVFMASRFVLSRDSEFEHERAFAKTIGTNKLAPPTSRAD